MFAAINSGLTGLKDGFMVVEREGTGVEEWAAP